MLNILCLKLQNILPYITDDINSYTHSSQKKKNMTNSELVFIPSPGAGHLPPTVELAKLLLHRENRLSITIIIMKVPFGGTYDTETLNSTPRLRFIKIPSDESTIALISPATFLSAFVEHHKSHVRNIVCGIIDSNTAQLVGFVVDMFCVAMVDVANEFGAPTYTYFTSGAAILGLLFYLQTKRDEEDHDVTELKKDSESELSIPSYINPVPVKVLPDAVFDKEGGSKMFLDLPKRFRQTKGIIVNSFHELESHGIEFLSGDDDIPPVFPVGPILNLKNTMSNDNKTDDIMTWLNEQPERSVVFMCFGSMGSFPEKQIKEMAAAIERSGQRFLWSLRRPTSKEKIESHKEYEDPDEVLPEGFLERTSGVGKVIGWAPQMRVLSHPSVGGFVSHCGWNSTLESIWCGVPIAAWPIYAEQQANAFQLVVDLGIAADIRMDYRTNIKPGGKEMFVTAEEIESGIRRVMSDAQIRKKAKEMKQKSRFAVSEGGSSYASIGCFIHHLMNL
ncbi:hypothetical protein L6452_24637 [Arctium lappa]|uniref:Uncharacterized protein n=1 Tax=Arctium lappa TaxID=4217 RepID=A0ACB9AAF4_ARCLA|nr:hypothetical protein L6452_24637 [Arctium lappa]